MLGTALIVLAAAWLGYTAWSAGRALAGQPLSSPAVTQWIALAAGPLALLGLVWLMFGRTRRKEAERFTRSVVTMRTEARSLEALLEVLSQRINDSRSELTMISRHLMDLGDQATGKLGGITREFDSSSEKLQRHGEALDRAAEAARNDMAVLLEDLPRAETTARALADHIRSVGSESAAKAASFGHQVDHLAERTREADRLIAEATDRLAARLAEIEHAGARRRARSPKPRAAFPEPSTACSTAPRRRSRRFARGSTRRPQRSPLWSTRPRPAWARPGPIRPKRSARTSAAPPSRSRRCRARSPSRNGPRSGWWPRSIVASP